MLHRYSLPVAAGLLLLGNALANDQPTRLLRFADIFRDQVTFVYSGDIYIAPISGGRAQRLTSATGEELFPKFSPNGKQIAFSAQFSGNRQVYVMDVHGKNLHQLTFYNDVGTMPPRGGYDYRVLDWTPNGKNVLLRANRLPWGVRMGRPYRVPAAGGMATPLAVPEGGGGMLSPDGSTLLYTPIDREWRTWKHYRGGRAQDVWTYNLKTNTSKRLTNNRATDQQPVWVGNDIYFVSDRKHTLNLFHYVPGAEPEQVTRHTEYDVLWPSAGPAAIVYENGGFLYRFDPPSGASTQLNIQVGGVGTQALPRYVDVRKTIQSFAVSPNGERALFAGRGELFSVPRKHGEIRNLSRSPRAREISPQWSPDGRNLVFLSDASGEYEIYTRPAGQRGPAKRITRDGRIWRFPPAWSPDGSKLIFADKAQTLWMVEIRSGKLTRLDQADRNDITDYQWAPDNNWIAYTKIAANGLPAIWLYSLKRHKAQQLTRGDEADFSPRFDPLGRYLYFLSNRDYKLSFSAYEFNYLYTDATRIYAATLAADGPTLFPPMSDEGRGQPEPETEEESVPDNITIDFAGFAERAVALPGDSGDYANLTANKDGVFVLHAQDEKNRLEFISVKERKDPDAVLPDVDDYVLAGSGEKILAQKKREFAIVEAKPEQKFADNKLDLSHLTLKIDPRTEWASMYSDAWRILRDWFYDPNMHGAGWDAVRARYQPLADAVASRADLNYVFNELAGELRSSHAYVQHGDEPKPKRVDGGLLGADIEADNSGYFRIAHVFRGENWHEDFRAPLNAPGLRVKDGDFILAVNGISTETVKNFYQLLENTAGRQVDITINRIPSTRGQRRISVRPVKRETNLRYLDWVKSRQALVDRLSGGRIGYIHVPNTAEAGNRELFKHFLPQVNKQALVIDDRYNGGGFIPDRMIELLSRQRLNFWKQRGLAPNPTPLFAHTGPKAMLINGYSSSGGDALPYYFRKLKLGPLIGTRTWGGLIGISGNPGLADGGLILVPTFRFLDTDGRWAVENEGVAPDIEVIDRPELVAAGHDPSLERAVKELLGALAANPPKTVNAPPSPRDFP